MPAVSVLTPLALRKTHEGFVQLQHQVLVILSRRGLLRCIERALTFGSIGADHGPEPAGV